VCWHIFVIPAPERLKKENPKFQASLGYIARSCFKRYILQKPKTMPAPWLTYSKCWLVTITGL
jgi:hypothetical protein